MQRLFVCIQIWFCVYGMRDLASCKPLGKVPSITSEFPFSQSACGCFLRVVFVWDEDWQEGNERLRAHLQGRGCSIHGDKSTTSLPRHHSLAVLVAVISTDKWLPPGLTVDSSTMTRPHPRPVDTTNIIIRDRSFYARRFWLWDVFQSAHVM